MAISITIAVDSTVVRQIDNVPWQTGMRAQDAMEAAYHTGSGFSFLLQYFGKDLGYEVMSIDNIASQSGNDTGAYLFWEFSVKGSPSTQGIDETILADGDKIGWNYIRYDPAVHGSGRRAALKVAAAKS